MRLTCLTCALDLLSRWRRAVREDGDRRVVTRPVELGRGCAGRPAVEAAKVEARRIGERQCEHALIMQRINKFQPGTPERINAEKELGGDLH